MTETFTPRSSASYRIAVIGTGISGLAAAYLLSKRHRVTVFEKNDYIGGHAHTVVVSRPDGEYPVDTGFIVYNHETYPHFCRLMDTLGVEGIPTTMSFSVHPAPRMIMAPSRKRAA